MLSGLILCPIAIFFYGDKHLVFQCKVMDYTCMISYPLCKITVFENGNQRYLVKLFANVCNACNVFKVSSFDIPPANNCQWRFTYIIELSTCQRPAPAESVLLYALKKNRTQMTQIELINSTVIEPLQGSVAIM